MKSSPSDNWYYAPYESIDKLIEDLVKERASNEIVKNKKQHNRFLSGYLNSIGAKSYVIENKYVDKDFLTDYTLYYAKCFKDYGRLCKRVHFFNKEYTKKEISDVFFGVGKNEEIQSLQESYLGFIIIKPLPETVIGRTCLKTYEENNGRNYLTTRLFHANLFGIDLDVKTLPFQEQDSVVSACATSAL